jgi:hypothetical protein
MNSGEKKESYFLSDGLLVVMQTGDSWRYEESSAERSVRCVVERGVVCGSAE